MSDVIDHVGIRVGDLPASRRLYEAALAELAFSVLGEGEFEGDAYVLFGRGESDDFSLHTVGRAPGRERVTTGAHVAFTASSEDAVERWHSAAVRHGGADNGQPGLRPEYSGRYYRPHRDRRSGSRRGQAVLRRPHVRPRAPRVVRDGPWGPLNYGPDGARGSQLFFYEADEPGTYSRRATGLRHLAFLVASRAVVREAHRWACGREAVVLDEPQEFPQYGEHCYATYWLDPHGFKLEAVCHSPEFPAG